MEKYQILVKGDRLMGVMEDWLERSTCDLTLRMAKTKGPPTRFTLPG